MFYSTPEKYIEAILKKIEDKSFNLTDKINTDFYPYADNTYSYWTGTRFYYFSFFFNFFIFKGYFTTNPNLKSETRYLGKTLE